MDLLSSDWITFNRSSYVHTLVPPALGVGTEVNFCPGGEDDLSRLGIDITVGKGKWKRGGSTDDGTSGGVLGSVAWALELVGGGRPWDNATQMSAHSVKTVRLKCLVFLDDQVAVRRKRLKIQPGELWISYYYRQIMIMHTQINRPDSQYSLYRAVSTLSIDS